MAKRYHVLSTACATFSSVVFVATAVIYLTQRSDAEWRMRVPFYSALYYVTRSDVPVSSGRFQNTPPVMHMRFGGNRVDDEKMLGVFRAEIGCNRTLPGTVESPRCECLVERYAKHMQFSNLNANDLSSRWRSFVNASVACMDLRGAYETKLFENTKATVVFDLVVLWWFSATLLSLSIASAGFHQQMVKYALGGVWFVVLALGIWIFAVSTHDKTSYLVVALLFGTGSVVPELTRAVLAWLTNMFRSDGKFNTINFQHGYDEFNILLATQSAIRLVVAQRAVMLFSGRNDVTEVWAVTWLCVFVAGCSYLLRLLAAAGEIHHGVASNWLPRARSFAAWWVWTVLLATALVFLFAFPTVRCFLFHVLCANPLLTCVRRRQDALHVFGASLLASRAAVGALVVVFALQAPALALDSDSQLAFFHVFEGLARLLVLAPLWFYLLG